MSWAETSRYPEQLVMADRAAADERADFIAKTYLHLAGAVMAFAGLEAMFLTSGLAEQFLGMLTQTPFAPILLVGGFILVSYVAESWARSAVSPAVQYMGLGLYVAAESVIFAPLLLIASQFGDNVIETAAIITLTLFTALTVVVFATRKNFSFLAPALTIASFGALGLIICSAIFGFSLGIVFTVAMVVLACGYILYDTSNVLHRYAIGQHVAASLALFASVALMFWYVIRLVMSLQSRD